MEMESDLEEPDFTHNDLEHDVDWITANDSNGDFSRDACQFIRRIPVAKREIPIIWTRNRSGWNVHDGEWNVPCILVYGIVHDLVVRASIYLTQYRNVIRLLINLLHSTPSTSTISPNF